MEIRNASFIKGVIGSEGLPQPSRPTVALFGRSNVGKSSVVNCLTGSTIARATKRPGRTTEINYYLVDGRWHLADLPGYGFAKLPPALRDKISGYLSWFAADKRVDLRLAILIVDGSIGPKASDEEAFALLRGYGRPLLILANKCDKESQLVVAGHLERCRELFPGVPIIPFSAKKGKGRKEVLSAIAQQLLASPTLADSAKM